MLNREIIGLYAVAMYTNLSGSDVSAIRSRLVTIEGRIVLPATMDEGRVTQITVYN